MIPTFPLCATTKISFATVLFASKADTAMRLPNTLGIPIVSTLGSINRPHLPRPAFLPLVNGSKPLVIMALSAPFRMMPLALFSNSRLPLPMVSFSEGIALPMPTFWARTPAYPTQSSNKIIAVVFIVKLLIIKFIWLTIVSIKIAAARSQNKPLELKLEIASPTTAQVQHIDPLQKPCQFGRSFAPGASTKPPAKNRHSSVASSGFTRRSKRSSAGAGHCNTSVG